MVPRTRFPQSCRRGVTLTELLVVLAIIGLLATMAVPVYLNHIAQARIRTAGEEVERFARAEDLCALQHNFYVPLQVLDNLAPNLNVNSGRRIDDLLNTAQVIDPLYLVDPFTSATMAGSFSLNQHILQEAFTPTTGSKRVVDLYNFWNGPFMTFKRVWTGRLFKPDVPEYLDDQERALDWPLDPWQNPYRLYTPQGIVGTQADQTDIGSYDNYQFGDGRIHDNGKYHFDRFAIVSFGPNGQEGDDGGGVNSQDNDDIIYYFGAFANPLATRFF